MQEMDNKPTPERIKKLGEKYQPPAVSQQVSRPYGRSRPALEIIRSKGQLKPEQYEALTSLQVYMNGAKRYLGLVSSYGEQRWDGTLASQEEVPKINEDWPIYCGQQVEGARKAVNHDRAWTALLLVLEHDLLLVEVGEGMGYKGKLSQKVNGWKWFHEGVHRLMAARHKSDNAQTHPAPA